MESTTVPAPEHQDAGSSVPENEITIEEFIATAERVEASYTGHRPADLRAVLAGDLKPQEPDMLARVDGRCLMYSGKRHWLQGEPESGKSWLALLVCAEQMNLGRKVVYIDWEDSVEGICGRLRLLGVTDDTMVRHLNYISPPDSALKAWQPYVESFSGASLVVFDACTEAMIAEGLDPEKNAAVEEWLQRLPRLARTSGAAILVIDHVVKSYEGRGRYAIGGGHKLGATDVSYSVHMTDPIAPGAIGRVGIKIEKDRPGGVRAFALSKQQPADLVVDATNEQFVAALLYVPKEKAKRKSTERMLEKLHEGGVPKNKTALVALMTGNNAEKHRIVEELILDGVLVPVDPENRFPKYVVNPDWAAGDD